MRKLHFWILLPLATLLLFLGTEETFARKFRIMTFNIRLLNENDGINHWDNRKEIDLDFIKRTKPDVFGLQESTYPQLHYLDTMLTNYGFVGVGRDDGKQGGEYSPVFYQKEKYNLINSGTFWLSETPEQVSLGWDGACRRVCSWAVLQNKKTGHSFVYANTHLDHVGKKARANGALLIKSRLSQIANNLPVLITGDFNVTDQSEAYQTMCNRIFPLNDAWKVAAKTTGMTYTFHNWGKITEQDGEKIDFIFVSPNIKVKNACVFNGYLGNGLYLSDHHPHYADLDAKLF